eukprot:10546669-Alexandrium_andersonii.AAC.1
MSSCGRPSAASTSLSTGSSSSRSSTWIAGSSSGGVRRRRSMQRLAFGKAALSRHYSSRW